MFGRHKHKMSPVAVSALLTSGITLAVAGGQKIQTVILFRCDEVQEPGCVETKIVDGRWDLHDLGATPPDWPAELKVPDDTHRWDDPAKMKADLREQVAKIEAGGELGGNDTASS
jgi:hypothetical protein